MILIVGQNTSVIFSHFRQKRHYLNVECSKNRQMMKKL
jgi:hypothetical protein